MDKRYQVFVSSTFQDLQEERQEVMQALLELNCIPAGMELFPAGNDDQWTLIKRVIDDCDYYIVIVAGRYGSIGATGKSYTEMEYHYAAEKGKPIIAFLHKDPGKIATSRSEKTTDGQTKLAAFRALTQTKAVKYWNSPSDLGSKVSRSIVLLIQNSPAVGWIRSDQAIDEASVKEILKLKGIVDDLEAKLDLVRSAPPPGTDRLAQGADVFKFQIEVEVSDDQSDQSGTSQMESKSTWNNLFAFVSPFMIDELSESGFKNALDAFAASINLERVKDKFKGWAVDQISLSQNDFQTVKVQLRALGLIVKSEQQRVAKRTGAFWTLTPYGDEVMTRLRAIRKAE